MPPQNEKRKRTVLTWNEIRERAYAFTAEWHDYQGKEIAETQSFWNDFFNVFGVARRSVAAYERSVDKLAGGKGRIDLFWPGMLLAEQKKSGRDLEAAKAQALDYCLSLSEKERPRFLAVCDFARFHLIDLEAPPETEAEQAFDIKELPQHIDKFWFIAGYSEKTVYADMDSASVQAARLMARLYDAILENNPAHARLDVFMVRLLYCFFADDTEIFKKDALKRYLSERTAEDGSDLGPLLLKIFQTLNTPPDSRSKALDEELAAFPYINGHLFEENLYSPDFDSKTRQTLLETCFFDWSEISPAIFGSLFQNISDPAKRRALGEHYTSEKNILKTLSPLFLDRLRAQLDKAGQDARKLEAFLSELAGLTFLDPACGCGNFLVVAYRELRLLELEALQRLHRDEIAQRGRLMSVEHLSRLNVNQFYGIEIAPFAARIAQTALWLTDHQMNLKLSAAFGCYYARIPLAAAPHIVCANALRMDWAQLIEPARLSYIMGNPPFVGYHYKSKEQQEESQNIFVDVKGAGFLDYVANWYLKAAEMMQANKNIVSAFVSADSIIQGTQVAPLWLTLLNQYGAKIWFAHRSFKWNNEASHAAQVYCVIIGFALKDTKHKRLWDYHNVKDESGHESPAANINPYILDGPDIVVQARAKPLSLETQEMLFGSKPADGSHFFFTPEEKEAFWAAEPQAKPFLRRVLGSEEFINNKERWCLWLQGATPNQLKAMPLVLQRIQAVAEFRKASKKEATRRLAAVPALFAEMRQPDSDYLLIPRVSSERRIYIPIGYISKDIIVTDAVFTLANATPYTFGMLASLMHMVWTKYVCGRLKSDYRYSNTIVYNNFPWPLNPPAAAKRRVEERAQALLALRHGYLDAGESYAALYDPNTMPADLLKAHQALDRAVDACYGRATFADERARIEFLFNLYYQRTETLLAGN